MTFKLVPSLLRVNNQLLEAYARKSRATDEIKQDLGLPLDQDLLANIGLASIEEYIVLQTNERLNVGAEAVWSLSSLETPVKIESIFIDSPQADKFEFEILAHDDSSIFKLNLARNQTPYDLPEAPLSNEFKIRIIAKSRITLIRIICKPVIILDYIFPDGSLPPEIEVDPRSSVA